MSEFPFCKQLDAMDCGPACLQMIAQHYGRRYTLDSLRERSFLSREGVSLRGIKAAAMSIGMQARGVRATYDQLARASALPCIIHWKQRHFIVVYGVTENRVCVADPECGVLTYNKEEFLQGWLSNGNGTGIALLLDPTPEFFTQPEPARPAAGFRFLRPYLTPYRKQVVQLLIGLLAGSAIQLILPLLSQMLVDVGIGRQNVHFMYVVLAAQLMLFLSRTGIEFFRQRILLHVGTRINIALLSDFLLKLMKLPLGFFETKTLGDLLQRIDDHERIEDFLTTSTLSMLFSFVNLVIFSVVLAWYNLTIFGVFLLGSSLYLLWGSLFLQRRRTLDFKRFEQLSAHQGKLIEIITGICEIKLNTCEQQQQQAWAAIQKTLFNTNVAALTLSQFQEIGMVSIHQLQNIFITFLSVKAVIDGSMTLGMVLAVQYILGQLYGPIDHFIAFIQNAQDAKISLERIEEIHRQEEEDMPDDGNVESFSPPSLLCGNDASLAVSHVSFRYGSPHAPLVLEDVSLQIPAGKITAIVGSSGSGKTTLLKLLLGFYPPAHGSITVGERELADFSPRFWRSQCGTVMQDGFLFSDTIAHNIALGSEKIDPQRLRYAAEVASIDEFIASLPSGYDTHIGADGYQLSQGQKQRLLIARAVYKNPQYLFFDEATNALDAENERVIIEQLTRFFQGHTVVVVAHRLSTVKYADHIVVLERGHVREQGSHSELITRQGRYYQLVKNQLDGF